MIAGKLQKYSTHFGCLSTNILEYGNSFGLVFDKMHCVYVLIETSKDCKHSRTCLRGGLDIIGYHLAKYS